MTSTASFNLLASEAGGHCVRLVPPQSNDDSSVVAGKGAYCFVIDVSGSMNAAAEITTDDGDKVNHGWSQLDIAKHSTNTFVSSLTSVSATDGDYFSVVTYSDGATVLLDWTLCDEAGIAKAVAAIHSMRPERSTNLMAGITTGGFVVEIVFAIPGLGRYFVQAIQQLDYTVIMGTTVFYGAFLVFMVILVDLFYGLIDPRVRVDQ